MRSFLKYLVSCLRPAARRLYIPIDGRRYGLFGPRYRVINVIDLGIVGAYLSTEEGERLLMNILRRNPPSA